MDSYLPYVGFVQFPRGPHDLTSAVCPACFTPRSSRVCPTCSLDLGNPAISQLDSASTDAAAALDRRLELIGRIRHESSAAAAPVAAPPVPIADPVPVAQATAVPATAVPAPEAEPRRHLGVQVVLLIVGVSLLAVGAIFFLVYAFITFGLVWRSVIIGAVTVAAFVGASLLRRRSLFATAEAIAALAVVFVYLDAFAIRANDLFGASGADGLVYWGAALVVSSIGLFAWHRLSSLRLPNMVAFLAFAPGLALLVGGLTEGLDDGVRVFAAVLALAVGGLSHPLTGGRTVERVTSLVLASLGLVSAAFVALFVEPDTEWAPLVTFALVAVVALAHVVLLSRLGVGRIVAIVIAGFGAAIAASALFAVASRLDDTSFTVSVPLVGAVVIALALEATARRWRSGVTIGAAWSAAGVAAIGLIVVAGGKLLRALVVAASGADRWAIRGGDPVEVAPRDVVATVALLAVVGLCAAAWALGGTLARRRVVLVAAGLGILVLSVPLLPQFWLVVVGWLALATVCVVLLIVGRRRAWGRGIRLALLTTGLLALALEYSASWASIDTWWFGSVGAVALLVVARLATGLVPLRAALVGIASILALVAIGSEAWHTNERFQDGSGAALDSLHAVSFLAILLVGAALALSRVLSPLETRVLLWIALLTAFVTAALSWSQLVPPGALVLPELGTSIVLGALLVVALLAWSLVRTPGFVPERLVIAGALAPAAAWLLTSIARQVGTAPVALELAPLAAALVVAAVALAVPARRAALDVGVGLVAIPTLVFALGRTGDTPWIALLVTAVITLVLAVTSDGLFASASPRKHLGWVALGLGFAGLSWALVQRDVTDLEPYLLPLTGALLLVALGARRADRGSTAPAFIALGALLVSIVPLASVSGSGTLVRPLVIGGASALLLLVGSFARGSRYLDVAAAVGAVGVLVTGLARPVRLALDGATADASLDVWIAASVALLLVAAVGQSRRAGVARGTIAQVAVVVALAGAVVVELAVLRDAPVGLVRALVLVAALATLHVAGMLVEKPPFTRPVGWVALGLAAVVGVAGSVVGAIDPFEWATVMIALALLIVGAEVLRRYPDASSWPWLAPGLLVLLLPSLVATFADQPVWRLVGIGVACVAAIVVGALAKLQAPLILGTVIVLVHAVRTFSPQLVAVYQLTEWWVWAVIGGAIIIFVAVTFERRMRDLKSLGGRISALR